jgi:branched-chain amino acid transport system permease protein
MSFFIEVLLGGLLSGVMYALVAIGFVLIYKASGVFNFAQGAMVFFAALTCVGFVDKFGVPLWLAILVMIVLAFAIERVVLRPLVNQPEITLFMATIGLAFFIEGLAQLLWGSQVRKLDLPIEDVPNEYLMEHFNILVSQFDMTAAVVCAVLVIALALLFTKTRVGRAPTTTRRRWRSASRCSGSGSWCGRWPGWWRWWRACCGAPGMACSSR